MPRKSSQAGGAGAFRAVRAEDFRSVRSKSNFRAKQPLADIPVAALRRFM